NRLELDRFRASISSDEERWLEEKLKGALDRVVDAPEPNVHRLRNLLQLCLAVLKTPSPLDWVAYDTLGALLDDQVLRREIFREVGAEMWRRWWRGYFASGGQDPAYPVLQPGREWLRQAGDGELGELAAEVALGI
ncbi:hypothetical protein, partial [Bacillus cereus]|uniref:hypothetical protein n=1 Tax=Bacillus cereus TaxID=1396 RepID=UPI0039E15945